MNKKLLAVAVVGALASPVAFAQGTTMYGIFDIGYQNASAKVNPGPADNENSNFIQEGQSDPSRFGVKGSEDLEGGMYAMYGFEFNMPIDTGGAPTLTRLGFAGLGSKAWGELTLGRQYTHLFHTFAVGSAHGYGTFASAYGQTLTQTRASNSVKYSSPVFNGFSFGAIWSPSGDGTTEPFANNNAAAGTVTKSNYFDGAIRYTPGPFGVAIAYGQNKNEMTGPVSEDKDTLYEVSANWDNKAFGIYGNYQNGKNETSGSPEAKASVWSLSGVARFGGRHEVYAMYSDLKFDEGDVHGKTYGLVYQNRMSKRTYVYAGIGHTTNETNTSAGVATTVKPTAFAITPAGGEDATGFQLGISHSF